MREWQYVHTGVEGDDLEISGIHVWRENWRPTGDTAVQLPDPIYKHQQHRLNVYEAGPLNSPIRFAAGEFSNGVWGFYVPAH